MLGLLLVQCSDNTEEEPLPQVVDDSDAVADHTLLVYIAGDNSLSGYADNNIRLMEKGLLKADSSLNLIVFEDNQKLNKSILFRLERHNEKLDTVQVADLGGDLDSADPEVMKRVVKLAFANSPAKHNGVILWSHGMSWIPSSSFTASASRTGNESADNDADDSSVGADAAEDTCGSQPSKMAAYFGQDIDYSDYMELWELRSALEEAPHLDYILVDACYFSTVEVAYELRGVTDYLLAAPTEVFGTGFPYQNILSVLPTMNDDNRESVLTDVALAFQNEYGSNGTLALVRTAAMEQVMTHWLESRERYAQVWAKMQNSPKVWFNRLQRYGRNRVGALYYFYDFADVLNQVAAEAGDSTYQADVSDAVAWEYHSAIFTDYMEPLTINTSCGLGVSVPELFQLASNSAKMTEAYPLTQWGAATKE
jgi:hypothetical protein